MANKTSNLPSYKQLDFRSMSITLLGSNNNTMSGTVNLSAFSSVAEEVDDYDDMGAAYYVCAVILVYGLSIVSLIGSLAKKKMKDNKYEQEEVQIHKYLHKVPDLREKSARDNFRQLKKNVIKLVEEKSTPSPTPDSSVTEKHEKGGFHFPKKHGSHRSLDKDGSRNGLDKRPATPHHHGRTKHGTKAAQKLVPPENQFLLAGDVVEEDEEDKGKVGQEPTTPATATPGMEKSLPFERMQSIDSASFEPEEKITVVQSLPSSMSDPGGLKSAPRDREPNVLMKAAEEGEDTKPKYRWSLGADGNIWIMQVDEKGEEKPAAPPKVDSLPAPPSPGYVPPKFSQRYQKQHSDEPVPSTSQAPSVSYENEVPMRRKTKDYDPRGPAPHHGRPQAIAPGGMEHPSARPKVARHEAQQLDAPSARPRHPSPQPPSPTRRSPVPPGRAEPVGQRVMALHPGAAQRLASTGQTGLAVQSPHKSFQPLQSAHQLALGVHRGSRPETRDSTSRSSSRSPSPRDPEERNPTGYSRGASLSPPLPSRYGPRLSLRLSGSGSRDRSRSPKPGSRQSSPQPLSSKPDSPRRGWGGRRPPGVVQASDEDEELMQVTCV